MAAPRILALALLTLVAGSTAPDAQKLGREPFEDALHGLRVRLPTKWEARGLPARSDRLGILFHFAEGDEAEDSHVLLFQWDERDEEAEDDPDPVLWVPSAVDRLVRALHDRGIDSAGTWSDPPLVDELVLEDDRALRHVQFAFEKRSLTEPGWFVDLWVVPGQNGAFALAYVFSGARPPNKRVAKVIRRSVESLEHFEPIQISQGGDYASVLAYHQAEVAALSDWRIEGTPEEKFVLKTSHEDEDFVEDVIDRLERSRELFERDFPPPPSFRHVSIVRLCSSSEEFHQYGGTRRGVMGWFNPGTTELVLYDAQDIDRNMSFAVMTHEAFHQYCYFLFGRAEAHRWFDEGHGDYYGGIKWSKRGRAEVGPRMPSGLDRLGVVRELVRAGTYQPLEEHLNATHREWQLGGVPSYAQSWSIVYMLRQGMLGKVHRKVWREEYADILPNYIEALRAGFAAAHAELAEEDEGATVGTGGEHDQPPQVSPERKASIWKNAIAASWGKIDLGEFEENWRLYVKKYLK